LAAGAFKTRDVVSSGEIIEVESYYGVVTCIKKDRYLSILMTGGERNSTALMGSLDIIWCRFSCTYHSIS
jgi:hypothetical protein